MSSPGNESATEEQPAWVEAIATIISDPYSDVRVEQGVHMVAPHDNREAQEQLVADALGRTVQSIDHIDIITDSPRDPDEVEIGYTHTTEMTLKR